MSLSKKAISIIAASVVAVGAVGGTAYGIKTNADKKALAESESISVSIEQSISESVIASEKAASELAEKLSKESSTSTTAPTTEKDNDLESRVEELEKKHTTTTEPVTIKPYSNRIGHGFYTSSQHKGTIINKFPYDMNNKIIHKESCPQVATNENIMEMNYIANTKDIHIIASDLGAKLCTECFS